MSKHLSLSFRAVDRDKFDQIVNGIKTIETRAATVKYQDLSPGDTIRFSCDKQRIGKTISFVRYYSSIEEMLEDLPLDKILPDVTDLDGALKVYYGFPGYEQKIKQSGIVALGLE